MSVGRGEKPSVSLSCGRCGGSMFRLRRADVGADAECVDCGAVIPNSVLRAATSTTPPFLHPPSELPRPIQIKEGLW